MSKCSIKGCASKKYKDQKITSHRLPRNEQRKREWLDAIGEDNIRSGTKAIYICSLHFEDNCFNKTLQVMRLRDEAMPTIFSHDRISAVRKKRPMPKNQQRPCARVVSELGDAEKDLQNNNPPVPGNHSRPLTQVWIPKPVPENQPQPLTQAWTPNTEIPPNALAIIKRLRERCHIQAKKIKCLCQKVRRQAKRIQYYRKLYEKPSPNKKIESKKISKPLDFIENDYILVVA